MKGESFYINQQIAPQAGFYLSARMDPINSEQQFQDSNSLFSAHNFLPLSKRETTKKNNQITSNTSEKIDQISYQVVEELTLITPLDMHPSKFCEDVETFYYQRKLPSVMEQELRKRQQREKIDFIMALTSLFRKSFGQTSNKFTILLPNGGLVYFFMEEVENSPLLLIASHNSDFSHHLEKEGIKFNQLVKKQYERQRLLIEGQYIRLFYGYFLNWVINKNLGIEIFSNFMFDYAFRQLPIMTQLIENRSEYQHLYYKEETCIGQKMSKLFLIKFQSMWSKEDIRKIEEKIRFYEQEYERKHKIDKIQHDFQFKIYKFTVDLNQQSIARPIEKSINE